MILRLKNYFGHTYRHPYWRPLIKISGVALLFSISTLIMMGLHHHQQHTLYTLEQAYHERQQLYILQNAYTKAQETPLFHQFKACQMERPLTMQDCLSLLKNYTHDRGNVILEPLRDQRLPPFMGKLFFHIQGYTPSTMQTLSLMDQLTKQGLIHITAFTLSLNQKCLFSIEGEWIFPQTEAANA